MRAPPVFWILSLLLFLSFSSLSPIAFSIEKNYKRNTTYYDTAYGQSSCFFLWLSTYQHGWRPDPAPFFRGSTRCCRQTNEKRARQLRTTKLRNIKKLADHLLGPELSETMRDAEKIDPETEQGTFHLLPMPQGTPYRQTSGTYFLNSQCTESARYIQKA